MARKQCRPAAISCVRSPANRMSLSWPIAGTRARKIPGSEGRFPSISKRRPARELQNHPSPPFGRNPLMRALTVVPLKAGTARLDDVPEPPLEDGPVLVQTLALGICGTDTDILDGAY